MRMDIQKMIEEATKKIEESRRKYLIQCIIEHQSKGIYGKLIDVEIRGDYFWGIYETGYKEKIGKFTVNYFFNTMKKDE